MEYEELLETLALPPRVVRVLEQRLPLALSLRQQALALTDRNAAPEAYRALAEILGQDDMGMLACQLLAAAESQTRWEEMGIPQRIFLDTMGCFPRFLEETWVRSGRYCFDRGWWTWRQLSRTLFRVGALEYELQYPEGAVSLHIPSDADLSPESVDESLSRARAFLGRFFPEFAGKPMVCESWLLSPALGALLPEGSRILAFQRRFSIERVEENAMDCLEWLFSAQEDTPLTELREDTSLQRSVKKLLLAGGRIGTARGVLIYS